MKLILLAILAFVSCSAQAWDITANFDSGTIGSSSQGQPDGFTQDASKCFYTTEQQSAGGQSVKCTVNKDGGFVGGWGGIMNHGAINKNGTLYAEVDIYIPSSFILQIQNNSTPALKFMRFRAKSATGGHVGYIDVMFLDERDPRGAMNLSSEMWQQGDTAPYWNPFLAKNKLTRDTWHNIKVELKYGAYIKIWFDGVLEMNNGSLRLIKNDTDQLKQLYFFTFWNGGSPADQYLYLDEIKLSSTGIAPQPNPTPQPDPDPAPQPDPDPAPAPAPEDWWSNVQCLPIYKDDGPNGTVQRKYDTGVCVPYDTQCSPAYRIPSSPGTFYMDILNPTPEQVGYLIRCFDRNK